MIFGRDNDPWNLIIGEFILLPRSLFSPGCFFFLFPYRGKWKGPLKGARVSRAYKQVVYTVQPELNGDEKKKVKIVAIRTGSRALREILSRRNSRCTWRPPH